MPSSLRTEKDHKYTATAGCLAEPLAGKRFTPCCRLPRICRHPCGVLFLTFLGLLAITPVFGQSTLPLPSDGIQYVGARGSNANNGLSRGNAKASILAAFAALPSCHSGRNWAHCGSIKLGAGTYMISSPIVVDSPQVSIRGQGQGVTILDYTGTSGCAIEWTGYENGSWRTGGLYDLTIDGARAGAGACGLRTYDVVGFNARNVQIQNFSKSGSMGWEDTAINWFNERYNVSMTLYNNTTGWMVEGAHGRPGYRYPNTTFGYGNFSLWINTSASGQAGIRLNNHAVIQFSNLHIIENMVGGTVALKMTNDSLLTDCLVNFHFEGGTTGLDVDSTSGFRAIGSVNESPPMTDIFSGRYPNVYIFGQSDCVRPTNTACDFALTPYQKASHNYVLTLGSPADAGKSAELSIGVPRGSYNWPFVVGNSGTPVFAIDTAGNPHTASGFLVSAGVIRLFSGEAAHTFKTPYTSAPVCTATDMSSAKAVKIVNTTKNVTITGFGNDMVTWICTPAAN